MAVIRETLYRGHVVWKRKLSIDQGLFLTTTEKAVMTEGENEIFEGRQIKEYSQKVVAANAVNETTAVSFYGYRVGGNELHYSFPVETSQVLFDENINGLPAVTGRRPTVTHRLRYKSE